MARIRRDVQYGNGVILRTPEVVAGLGARRVLLVCGRRSFEASGAARMLPALREMAQVRRWSDFAPNTDAADLVAGLAVAAEFQPDLVLGVGGGSAMDLAKLLCAFSGLSGAAAVAQAIRTGAARQRRQKLVLAPTTSGSGSEATRIAVVYLGSEKFSVADVSLLPDVVIVDPTLARSGSPYQRATSGIDAVAQAVESMWAVGATRRSRGYARHALGCLLPAIEPFVRQPADQTARAMAVGSFFAGRAIDISRTTAAHALSYGITKRYGVSHGHAAALTLGAFIEAHATVDPARLRPELDCGTYAAVLAELLAQLGARNGPEGRERFGALLARLGLEPSLARVGAATPADRAALAAAVNAERLGNNPVAFSQAELAELIQQID